MAYLNKYSDQKIIGSKKKTTESKLCWQENSQETIDTGNSDQAGETNRHQALAMADSERTQYLAPSTESGRLR